MSKEQEAEKGKRELFIERLRAKYPDREYADDEALFGQIGEDYDETEKRIGEYEEREGKLNELLAGDPKAAQFITDMAKGVDPWVAVIERMGIDGVTDLMNDPAKQEAYAEANKRYVERLAREKDLEAEYQRNFGESMQMLERMQSERGLSDEMVDAAMDLVMKMANDAILGKFTPETVDMALKAVNHDADMENARAEGEVAGRNAKIEETLRKSKAGDGLPAVGGATVAVPTEKRKGFFDDLPRRKF